MCFLIPIPKTLLGQPPPAGFLAFVLAHDKQHSSKDYQGLSGRASCQRRCKRAGFLAYRLPPQLGVRVGASSLVLCAQSSNVCPRSHLFHTIPQVDRTVDPPRCSHTNPLHSQRFRLSHHIRTCVCIRREPPY